MNDVNSFCEFIKNKASIADLKLFQRTISKELNKISNVTTVEQAVKFVKHIPEFVTDETLLDDIRDEVKSLNLDDDTTRDTVDTRWLNISDKPYIYKGSTKKPVLPISNYPSISKLMGRVNSDPNTTGDANSCLVSIFPSGATQLGWHADDEEGQISPSSSISSFSLGSERSILFRRKNIINTRNSSTNTQVLLNYTLSNGSLTVMHPGCQDALKHNVPADPDCTEVRFSLSFRKFQNECEDELQAPLDAPISQNLNKTGGIDPLGNQNKDTSHDKFKTRAHLFVGDSLYSKLDGNKLKRGRNIKIINISEGGSKISKVKTSIELFHEECKDVYSVTKIFVSAGTNDIRYAKYGVKHLRAPYKDLISTIKRLFPEADIWCQSLLPVPLHQRFNIANDVIAMNDIVYDVCLLEKTFYIDMLTPFLDRESNNYYRNEYLFQHHNTVHPNRQGMGILASTYIKLIREKFNPAGY